MSQTRGVDGQGLGTAVSPTLGAGGGVSVTAPTKWGYDIELERELERRASNVDAEVVGKVAEVAFKVAEPFNTTFDNIDWTTTVAITRQDGIADFVYINNRVMRLPWRRVLPILLKDYPQVVFIDMRKAVKREKVVGALREELEQVKEELSRLARRKSKYANEMRAIYEKELNRIIKTLNYLVG
ncbi:MAG: hypothetical protein LM558_00580 [Thermosphaera sp.]|nr:hypothetical protein [Thermosphaera sp.]